MNVRSEDHEAKHNYPFRHPIHSTSLDTLGIAAVVSAENRYFDEMEIQSQYQLVENSDLS